MAQDGTTVREATASREPCCPLFGWPDHHYCRPTARELQLAARRDALRARRLPHKTRDVTALRADAQRLRLRVRRERQQLRAWQSSESVRRHAETQRARQRLGLPVRTLTPPASIDHEPLARHVATLWAAASLWAARHAASLWAARHAASLLAPLRPMLGTLSAERSSQHQLALGRTRLVGCLCLSPNAPNPGHRRSGLLTLPAPVDSSGRN